MTQALFTIVRLSARTSPILDVLGMDPEVPSLPLSALLG